MRQVSADIAILFVRQCSKRLPYPPPYGLLRDQVLYQDMYASQPIYLEAIMKKEGKSSARVCDGLSSLAGIWPKLAVIVHPSPLVVSTTKGE